TRLVLVNALYFLADWRDPFANDKTSAAPFFISRSRRKDVPTMHRTGTFLFAQKGRLKALEMPYEGDGTSMLVVLPEDIEGLGAFEASLRPERLEDLLRALALQRVAVSLPKFQINPATPLSLQDLLGAMGMGIAFDPQTADLSGIANPPDPVDRLCIGGVFHKAFVKVDEKGTEAAAATAAMVVSAGLEPPMKTAEFKADHPFLFFLRDRVSGLILFMGRVAEP
ncbi:MAG: serpin family protein, partial [Vicinamibacteria bacterium]